MDPLTDHEFAVEMAILWVGLSNAKRTTLRKLIQNYFDSPTELDGQTRADRIMQVLQNSEYQKGL
jgi:hypothetical protein